jgi:hypothetical protein
MRRRRRTVSCREIASGIRLRQVHECVPDLRSRVQARSEGSLRERGKCGSGGVIAGLKLDAGCGRLPTEAILNFRESFRGEHRR